MGTLTRLGGYSNPLSWISKFSLGFADEGGGEDKGGDDKGGEDKGEDKGEEKVKEKGGDGQWYSGFAEDVRNHPTTLRYKTNEAAMVGHIQLEKKIGANTVVVPGEKSSKEEIADFNRKIGVPEDSAKYEIFKPEGEVDERLQVTPESEASFRDLAHTANLTPAQARTIQEKYHEMQVNHLKVYDAAMKEGMQTAETELRKEWGAKYDENLAGASKLAKDAGGDEFVKWLNKGEGNNPVVIKALAKIASKMGEDSFGKLGKSELTLTPAEAKVRISEIRDNSKSAYNDDTHRLHKEAVEEMKSLYALAHPEPKKE